MNVNKPAEVFLNKTTFSHILQNNSYTNNSVSAAVPLQLGNVRREL
jgi:hypothetical protein